MRNEEWRKKSLRISFFMTKRISLFEILIIQIRQDLHLNSSFLIPNSSFKRNAFRINRSRHNSSFFIQP